MIWLLVEDDDVDVLHVDIEHVVVISFIREIYIDIDMSHSALLL